MSHVKPCPVCGVEKNIHAKCKSKKCVDSEKCLDCGKSLKYVKREGVRCYTCYRAYKLDYQRKYHGRTGKKEKPVKSLPSVSDGRCKSCPSLNQFGRCGGVLKGDKQFVPAVAVRLSGECPRQKGIRKDIDQWCKRRNNADLRPLEGHKMSVGRPGQYIDSPIIFDHRIIFGS